MGYQTDIITGIPADSLPEALQIIQGSPAYVHHHVIAEDNGEFTVIAIYRVADSDPEGGDSEDDSGG